MSRLSEYISQNKEAFDVLSYYKKHYSADDCFVCELSIDSCVDPEFKYKIVLRYSIDNREHRLVQLLTLECYQNKSPYGDPIKLQLKNYSEAIRRMTDILNQYSLDTDQTRKAIRFIEQVYRFATIKE